MSETESTGCHTTGNWTFVSCTIRTTDAIYFYHPWHVNNGQKTPKIESFKVQILSETLHC